MITSGKERMAHGRLGGVPGTGSSEPNPPLCVAATGSQFEPFGLVGAACSDSGVNLMSAYPPWSGQREEVAELTLPQSYGVGFTLIAVTSNGRTHSHVQQVYDQAGNTWTRDTEHVNTASSLDDHMVIWRCVISNPLAAGNYIRVAFNVGSSLLPGSESNARCLSVYAFAGILSDPVSGTGAGTFSGTVNITAPAGDLVIAGMSSIANSVTPDVDWLPMLPVYQYAGSHTRSVYAQMRLDSASVGWTVPMDAVLDWAAEAVAYTVSDYTFDPGDGHADLVGDDDHASWCGHAHHLFRTTNPTAGDDANDLIPVTTMWTNTTTGSTFLLLSNTPGAAVWQLMGSGDHGSLSGLSNDHTQYVRTFTQLADPAATAIERDLWVESA